MRRACAILLMLSLISYAVANASELFTTGESEIRAVFDAINSIRINDGLHVLMHEESATLAATLHAKELAERNLLSHRDLNGRRVAERYRFAGGTGTRTGENLGAGDSIESILTAWMESSTHRSNLLNPMWHNAGLGCVRTGKERIILVAIFSNSRWKGSSIEVDSGIATLSGQLIHPKNISLISIRLAEGEFGPMLIEPDTRRTLFSFPAPRSWQEGRVVSILLLIVESGITKQVDLLLLEIHTSSPRQQYESSAEGRAGNRAGLCYPHQLISARFDLPKGLLEVRRTSAAP